MILNAVLGVVGGPALAGGEWGEAPARARKRVRFSAPLGARITVFGRVPSESDVIH